jgi:hypothetical protein
MQGYKRNQVEEAIVAALEQAEVDAASDLRIRLKRLLETDRGFGGEAGANKTARGYAFYSGEQPGRGLEIWFSPYEAFALMTGALLMQHRWSQGTAVRIMRQARPTLEPEHRRILARDPKELFNEVELIRRAKPGTPAFSVPDPVFLAVITERSARTDPDGAPHVVSVCRGEEKLMQLWRERTKPGMSITVLEVAAPAWLLTHHLSHTEPRSRGRASR